MIRERLEKDEQHRLASYACFSIRSKGRLFDEPPSETRTCFQRDRDRIIHSKAFRRLKQKTQVFLATESDHYRSRLTHTLEVAQISRHLARLLRLNEDLAETIALAHDLGHTPFGHSGERVLHQLMKDEGGFEHNRQSRRVVDTLESKYPFFAGLNLSFETREGLIKHGAVTDLENPRFVTLEAQICNLSDEIAYNTHDIDDGIRSGILSEQDLLDHVPLWKMATELVQSRFPALTTIQRIHLTGSELISLQIMDVYEESTRQLQAHSDLTLDSLQSIPSPLIRFSDTMRPLNQSLRSYLFSNLYSHPTIYRMNKKGQAIITALFNTYSQDPKLIPNLGVLINDSRSIPRKVADYIAGMTDSFATKEYESICL